MIEWHSSQNPLIFRILRLGNLIWNIQFLFHQPHLASTASERKYITTFTGDGRGVSMIVPRPCPSSSKKLSIRAFIWGIYFCCTSIGSFRISKKAGDFFCSSLFLFILLQKSDRKLAEIFRYVRIVTWRIWIYTNWIFYIKSRYLRISKIFWFWLERQ